MTVLTLTDDERAMLLAICEEGIEEHEDPTAAGLRAKILALAEDRTHPGEPHRFGTSCIDCGEFGRIVLSIVGPDERVDIAPYVPLSGSKCRGLPDDEWRCAVHEGGWASGRLRGRGRCSLATAVPDAERIAVKRSGLVALLRAVDSGGFWSAELGIAYPAGSDQPVASDD